MSLLITKMLSFNNFSQIQLSGEAPDTYTTLIATPAPRPSSMFTVCFPDEIGNYEGIDEVMSYDDYVDELL